MATVPAMAARPGDESHATTQPRPKPAMSGWLIKRSHGVIKKKQRHWFELWGPELRYYESDHTAVATRIIMVNGCTVEDSKQFPLPPMSLLVKTPHDLLAKEYVLSSETEAELNTWKEALKQASSLPPLVKSLASQQKVQVVALVNSKSGGKQGPALKQVLTKHLGPNNVFDISQGGPKAGIQEHLEDGATTRFLVCGGDGTVGWTLQDVDKLKSQGILSSDVHVAVLPLGTGNDLARTLQCGGGYSGQKILPILRAAASSDVTTFDRWKLVIECGAGGGGGGAPPAAGAGKPSKEHLMCNYFSLGYDARVARMFHVKRELQPNLFKHRVINKTWYAWYGARNLGRGVEISKVLKVIVDGKEASIPAKVRALCVINIPSYSGGANLWGTATTQPPFQKPAIDDGMLEVVGTYGPLHSLGIMMGIRRADRIAQGRDIHITLADQPQLELHKMLYAQVDGEPFVLDSGGIHEDASYDAAAQTSARPPGALDVRITMHQRSSLIRNDGKPAGCCAAPPK